VAQDLSHERVMQMVEAADPDASCPACGQRVGDHSDRFVEGDTQVGLWCATQRAYAWWYPEASAWSLDRP
jgi:hypothetical protein